MLNPTQRPLKRLLAYGNGYNNPLARMRIRRDGPGIRLTLWSAVFLSVIQGGLLMAVLVLRPEFLQLVVGLSATGALIAVGIPIIISLTAFFNTQRFTETDVFALLRLSNLQERDIVQGIMFLILHYTRDLMIVPLSILPLLAVGVMTYAFSATTAQMSMSVSSARAFGLLSITQILDLSYATVVGGIGIWGVYLAGLGFGVGLGFRLKSAAGGAALIVTMFAVAYAAFVLALLLFKLPMVVTPIFCIANWVLAILAYRFAVASV